MTEPRRTRWFIDIWDDDDPGLVNMRNALSLRSPEPPAAAPRPVTTRSSETTPADPVPPPDPRPGRVAQLIQRVRDGDLGAVAALRELLDR